MKRTHPAHPADDELRAFALGRLADAESAGIERHLDGCAACCEKLGTLGDDTDADDPLLSRLRQVIPPTPPASMPETLLEPPRRHAAKAADASAATVPPSDLPTALRHHPRYRITERLGSGGMGVVFKAEHRLLHRTVVVKVIRPDLIHDPELAERFEREARMAARLSHPHVVTVYEAERLRDLFFVVMEFVDGQTLAQLLRNRGQLPVPVACELTRQAALGLQHLHEQGMVHRDVKPSNLMLADGGVVKVLDLGLALRRGDAAGKDGGANLTTPQHSMGTVDYMAPEQWQDSHEVDIRADVYSLGCTFYALLTGGPPFGTNKETNLPRQIWAHTLAPVPPVSDKRPEVPAQLESIVNKMLAKNQDDRFPVPAAVADALAPFCAGVDLAAYLGTAGAAIPPPPPPSRAAKPPTSASAAAAPTVRPPTASRRKWLAGAGALVAAAGLSAGGVWVWRRTRRAPDPLSPSVAASGAEPIRVGVLHSLTGTMAISEKSVVDATLFAVDEVNARGGLLGRPVKSTVVDGRSDPAEFAVAAERLIAETRVCTVFGCWTSAGRKTVRPIFEKHSHLLVYPLQYEGLEQSPNIIYTGAAPNQQILPAVRWCCEFLKKRRLFLVGSDYIFPRCANAIIRDQAASLGGEVVGEEYLLLGSGDCAGVIRKIADAKPDVILNTINGDSNVAFFRQLRAAGISPDAIPTISFSITEEEISNLSHRTTVGDYAVWNYFMAIDRPRNAAFIRAFRERFGAHRILTDPMEAAYVGVHLWAQAVRAAGSDLTAEIRAAMLNQGMDAPEGPVKIDPATGHTAKTIRIGQIVEGGKIKVVFASEGPITPVPYPPTRTRAEWEQFVTDLQLGWGGNWSNTGDR